MTMKSFNVNGVLFDEHFQNSDSKVVNLIIINSKQNIVVLFATEWDSSICRAIALYEFKYNVEKICIS